MANVMCVSCKGCILTCKTKPAYVPSICAMLGDERTIPLAEAVLVGDTVFVYCKARKESIYLQLAGG